MSLKHKVEIEEALPIAQNLKAALQPWCESIEIVGSLRRRKGWVGDIEVLYIPRFRVKAADLFSPKASAMVNLVDEQLERWLRALTIHERINEVGHRTWGEENKFAVHTASGLSVDFFQTDGLRWNNALVVRTGGKQNNINIASAARRLGWTFEASGSGFRSLRGLPYHHTTSERDVFEFVRLPYLEPQNRP